MLRYNYTFKDSGRPPNRPDAKVNVMNLCKASAIERLSHAGEADATDGERVFSGTVRVFDTQHRLGRIGQYSSAEFR